MSESHSVLLERVCQLIQANLPKQNASCLCQLAQAIYGHVSLKDLQKRSDSDLYGALLSLWNLLGEKPDANGSIRIFNPSLEQEGWHSNHTIIEIVIPDLPFLVDSVRMALTRLEISTHLLLHCPIHIQRSESGALTIEDKRKATETLFHIEVDRQRTLSAQQKLKTELASVLSEIRLCVLDWKPMARKLTQVISEVENTSYPESLQSQSEILSFLRWVHEHNFTLLGYQQLKVKAVPGDHQIQPVAGSALGLFKQKNQQAWQLSELNASGLAAVLSAEPLILTKSNEKSRIHRPALTDYIGIKRFDKKGKVIGEHQFIGLYSSSLYHNSAQHVPLLRSKLARIMALSGLPEGSHAFKALLNILETYPRDELLQATETELLQTGTGVLQMQERDLLRLFVRKELFGRYYSCMVYVSRDRYSTLLREKIQQLLQQNFCTTEPVSFTTYFSESDLARTHYLVSVKREVDVHPDELEQNLIEAARSWHDRFAEALANQFGEERGRELAARYKEAFPPSYQEQILPNAAMVDIDKIEQLSTEQDLGMLFYQPQEESGSDRVCLKLFHRDEPIPLSDVLPLLENLGLKVIGERPYEILDQRGRSSWILEFTMLYQSADRVNFAQAQERFQEALSGIWAGAFENDELNCLVLTAGLTAFQVSILRAYAKYMRQLGVSFSLPYIESALNHYPALARYLVELFELRFGAEGPAGDTLLDERQSQFEQALDRVNNLDEDRIFRHFQAMIMATLRTNAFLQESRSYLSFKLAPKSIPEVPQPVPEYEIFVYSPRFEGVHLRGGKVARGGLRWSDRKEDFRTEILGLVKAQQVKNSVIVPVGAKGGFVCKQLTEQASRDEFLQEGKACYDLFIRGLLDITDNLSQTGVIPPKQVIRYDEDDPYLVVAADKGTATFSDTANQIADEYGFWLGDAFASGGSQGYDHKKMGITAKGAWESVKRHFRELDIDCQQQEFSAVGIGDMAGDVFGNGMLLSDKTLLLAAFNHQHIFIDPTPDAEISYQERKRLFELARSSWSDYNPELLSTGGGIYLRSSKKIQLSDEACQALGLTSKSFTPNELIHQLLQAQVDLIWNGGIGTYIKSSSETHAQVGDRANDSVRVNGKQLKAKIFGEGGNLGATQLGRIEYARAGGRINSDFIDNVGGVDCSDNEVNIKVLLNLIEQEGRLTRKQRNQLLESMTADVSALVLDDCYQQTQSISVTEHKGTEQLKEQIRLIQYLEKQGVLNRALEYLPDEEELVLRQAQGEGLSRPELSVLISYDKMVLKERLLCERISTDSFHHQTMLEAFPEKLRLNYAKEMNQHPLRQEIIATHVANQVVNDMGLSFINRMRDETGADEMDIVSCYTIAREVFGTTRAREEIQQLDNQIPSALQYQALESLRRTLRRATRWFLRHRNRAMSTKDAVMFFKPGYQSVQQQLPQSLSDEDLRHLKERQKDFENQGLPQGLAQELAEHNLLFSALDITQISEIENRPIELISDIYFLLGARLQLHWFLEQVDRQPVANHWQALARASFREELDWQQRSLTVAVNRYCQEGCSAESMVELWFAEHHISVARWELMLNEFKTASGHEYAKFSVALRELMLLSHTSES